MKPLKNLSPSIKSIAAEYWAKIWMIIAAFLVGLNLLIALTLLQMAPYLKVIPQILTSPMNSQEFIQTEPLNSQSNSERKLIDEALVRYYLEMRLTEINDVDELKRRWEPGGVINAFSSPKVYNDFMKKWEDNGLDQKLHQIWDQGYTTSVHITNISRWNNTFVIDFDLYQYSGTVLNKIPKSATITVGFDENQYQFLRLKLSNPYGLFIETYTERDKKQ